MSDKTTIIKQDTGSNTWRGADGKFKPAPIKKPKG